jgi:hypothetical protein
MLESKRMFAQPEAQVASRVCGTASDYITEGEGIQAPSGFSRQDTSNFVEQYQQLRK